MVMKHWKAQHPHQRLLRNKRSPELMPVYNEMVRQPRKIIDARIIIHDYRCHKVIRVSKPIVQ